MMPERLLNEQLRRLRSRCATRLKTNPTRPLRLRWHWVGFWAGRTDLCNAPALYGRAQSVRARNAELDRLFQRFLHDRGWKERQRIGGDGAVMARARHRVVERAVLDHQADRMIEVGVARLALLKGAAPELALCVRAAPEGEHHRQRDLALAKIVADVLAELLRGPAVVERVVDELKRDAEVHAK